MEQQLFRDDNTTGYTNAQRVSLNNEWIGIVSRDNIHPGTEEYVQRSKEFSDLVAKR